ncbi:MAG: bile acid:sodium symporter family protein [Bacteroidota bacterium]|nr:bile acid:sodium symporter family protein [Bacteroidota bacterium]
MNETLRTMDEVRLNFNPDGLLLLNITLAFIMFGVAMGIKIEHFKELFRNPKSALVGIFSQFLVLPALTFLLVWILKPTPTVALGMILVAACPGGNISNFISHLAKANTALSVSLTAFATLAAIFMTPLNFEIWGGLYNATSPAFRPIEIDAKQMFQTVFIILGLPLIAGIWFAHKLPKITKKISPAIKIISIVIFLAYVLIALALNYEHFIKYIHIVALLVLVHNALALVTGYSLSSLFKLKGSVRRSITIETGIQNSGLALVLIFNPKVFPVELNLGGMAIIAAWWGVWHIISGLVLGYFWSRRVDAKSLVQ